MNTERRNDVDCHLSDVIYKKDRIDDMTFHNFHFSIILSSLWRSIERKKLRDMFEQSCFLSKIGSIRRLKIK